MAGEIVTYESADFGSIRMFEEDGEVYAVADDFAKALGYTDAYHMIRSLDPDEFTPHIVGGNKGEREANCLTEAGMYHAILMRRAACVKDPVARERVETFQRWVTHEVLPAIRRTGHYENPLYAPTREERMALALRDADEVIAAYRLRVASLESEADAMRPMAALGEAMLGSDDTILVRELAQLLTQAGYSIGQNNLYRRLREDGYLIAANARDRNQPTRRAIELGLFEVRETVIRFGGQTHIERTTRVTPRGQAYFLSMYAGVTRLPALEVA